MNNKEDILNKLNNVRSLIDIIMLNIATVDSNDLFTKRISINKTTVSMFELVETINDVEVEIYNYLRSLQ